jgi:hypothetical protein
MAAASFASVEASSRCIAAISFSAATSSITTTLNQTTDNSGRSSRRFHSERKLFCAKRVTRE